MDGLIAYALAKKYINNAIGEISLDGFDIQIEQDRSILNSEGQEKIIYFVPKTTAATQDGYDEYVYINNSWEKVGSTDIDMSAYALKSEIPDVSGKYEKPITGIPKTDLASDVQTSLGKADTALQSHQDISGKENTSNKVTSISAQSTDNQYPTAKCVYDLIGNIETLLQGV